MKCSQLLRIDQWTDNRAGFSAWYLPPVSWAQKDFQKSMSDVNWSFVFQPLTSFCYLQFDAVEHDTRDPPRSAQHLCPSGWSEPRVGKKESGILHLSIMALASLWSLCVGQEVSLLGKFAPVLVGAEHSQGTCQLAILPAKQWPGQTVHLVQGYQYINCPWNSLAGGLCFPSHESRGDLWLCLKLIIDVQCFLQIKRLCRATCFLRMRKCNKACSSPALQQSGRCSTASILSPVLPMGAVPIPPHLYSPTVLRNPTHAPKFFAWHRAFKANRTSKYLSVFSFLLRYVLCCLQCPPTLSFSVPTA